MLATTLFTQTRVVLATCAVWLAGSSELTAQTAATLAEVTIDGLEITVIDHTVLLKLKPDFVGNSVELPRLAAPLKSLNWQHEKEPAAIKLQPELQTWKLSWERRAEGADTIEMQLDATPALISEVAPITASGDGSLFLPAHLAATRGSKIRYEPQTFKNTVGYWAGMDNQCSWQVHVEVPAKFNVAILQGCGAGQGGSTAEISIIGSATSKAAAIEFEVQETGHFQNFIWRHLGVVEIPSAGDYAVQIAPLNIKRGALMDVRAVHLVQLP